MPEELSRKDDTRRQGDKESQSEGPGVTSTDQSEVASIIFFKKQAKLRLAMLAGGGTVVIFLSVVGGVVGWFTRTSSSALEELQEPEVTIFAILMSHSIFSEAKHLSIH